MNHNKNICICAGLRHPIGLVPLFWKLGILSSFLNIYPPKLKILDVFILVFILVYEKVSVDQPHVCRFIQRPGGGARGLGVWVTGGQELTNTGARN